MTQFGPTRAEMKFRLFLSLLGLILIAAAVTVRGVPAEQQFWVLLMLAIAFLSGSAAMSGAKLRDLDED